MENLSAILWILITLLENKDRLEEMTHPMTEQHFKQKNETKHQFMVIYIVNKMIAHIPEKNPVSRVVFYKLGPASLKSHHQSFSLISQKGVSVVI